LSTDELARAYIATIKQQRTQSTGPFGLIRGASERAPLGGGINCEECGLLSTNGQSICSRCRASTRLWLQFLSLGTLGVLTAYNYIFVLNFLSTPVPHGTVANLWLNVSEFASIYGWIALEVYLPAWAFYWWRKHGYSPETGVRVGIGFVLILPIGAVARLLFPRTGWTWAERLRTSFDFHPELGTIVGWAVVALAMISICCNCDSRDRLLGRGKGLALLALAVLCTILGLSLLTTRKNANPRTLSSEITSAAHL
jgi:hypothetical protein